MTEDQARQKRCCGPEGCGHVNGYSDNGLEYNHPAYRVIPIRWCIGSECQGWRWENFMAKAVKLVGDEKIEVDVETEAKSKAHGYCGLAGNSR